MLLTRIGNMTNCGLLGVIGVSITKKSSVVVESGDEYEKHAVQQAFKAVRSMWLLIFVSSFVVLFAATLNLLSYMTLTVDVYLFSVKSIS